MVNCDKQRQQLIHCVRQSECFKSGKTVKVCVKEEAVAECQVRRARPRAGAHAHALAPAPHPPASRRVRRGRRL